MIIQTSLRAIDIKKAAMTHKKDKRRSGEHAYKDPVCGMEVSRLTAADECDYQGKIYYFCSGTCREAFEAEPVKYVGHHRQHGLKPN